MEFEQIFAVRNSADCILTADAVPVRRIPDKRLWTYIQAQSSRRLHHNVGVELELLVGRSLYMVVKFTVYLISVQHRRVETYLFSQYRAKCNVMSSNCPDH